MLYAFARNYKGNYRLAGIVLDRYIANKNGHLQWVADHGAATLDTDYLATAHMDDPDLKGVADWFVGLCKGPNKDRDASEIALAVMSQTFCQPAYLTAIPLWWCIHGRKSARAGSKQQHLSCVREWICKHWVQDLR
jgi:hypothetical protein